MKTCLLISLLLSMSYSGISAADEFYMERRGSPSVTTCDNADAVATVAEIRQNRMTSRVEELREVEMKSNCYTGITGDFSYIIHDTQKVIKNGKNYNVTHVSGRYIKNDRYILSEDLVPYAKSAPQRISETCTATSSGQINRMETDKDGRLYLKKYMATSRCVNGKNVAVWKALN